MLLAGTPNIRSSLVMSLASRIASRGPLDRATACASFQTVSFCGGDVRDCTRGSHRNVIIRLEFTQIKGKIRLTRMSKAEVKCAEAANAQQ